MDYAFDTQICRPVVKRQGFRHRGEVVKIESGGVVIISFNRTAACDGCHAKGHCTVSAEGKLDGAREMRVVSKDAESFTVGDQVDVSITYRVGFFAFVMAYITPLVIFIETLVLSVGLGVDEGLSAVIGFVVAALYYVVVYLFRDRFEKVIDFELSKIE